MYHVYSITFALRNIPFSNKILHVVRPTWFARTSIDQLGLAQLSLTLTYDFLWNPTRVFRNAESVSALCFSRFNCFIRILLMGRCLWLGTIVICGPSFLIWADFCGPSTGEWVSFVFKHLYIYSFHNCLDEFAPWHTFTYAYKHYLWMLRSVKLLWHDHLYDLWFS